ncbi:MAG: DnaD domain protein [Defluviitaleaceae bacterium]|nr:DnaD domain protein [Defluviitaleaceae bacterium]
MYQLWQQGALNFGEILAITYKKLGLDEASYTFLVLFARLMKERPSAWSLSEIMEWMTVDAHDCSRIFMALIHDGFLLVESKEDETGRRSEHYSLAPLFLKIDALLKKESQMSRVADLEALAEKIEQIFGALSPKDIELIQYWISDDGFDPSLIEIALGEMQMHDIRSLKYVDKILLDWKRKNIYTVDEAKRSLIDFRRLRNGILDTTQSSTQNQDAYYNWIEKVKQELK